MKKLNTIIIVSIVVLLSLYGYQRDRFYRKFNTLEHKKENWLFGYYALPFSFVEERNRLPKDQREMIDLIRVMYYGEDLSIVTNRFMIDLLSSDDGFIQYMPIYNRQNKKIESCVMLSAGIDGKIDNTLKPTDTLYTDDWFLKLKTYNSDKILADQHPDGIINIVKYHPSDYFSIYDRFFGNKDYILIFYTPTQLN